MTKYILVNDYERTRFEKEYQLPLGYCNQHCTISENLLNIVTLYNMRSDKEKYLIEKHCSGDIEYIFPMDEIETIQ